MNLIIPVYLKVLFLHKLCNLHAIIIIIIQGSKGIRQWPLNSYIPNDYIQNYPFCRLQLVVETLGYLFYQTNQSKRVPKIVKQKNKKTLLENFGD